MSAIFLPLSLVVPRGREGFQPAARGPDDLLFFWGLCCARPRAKSGGEIRMGLGTLFDARFEHPGQLRGRGVEQARQLGGGRLQQAQQPPAEHFQ